MRISFAVRLAALTAALTLGALAPFVWLAFREDVAVADTAAQIALSYAVRNMVLAFPPTEVARGAPGDLAHIRANLDVVARANPGSHALRVYTVRRGAPVLLVTSSTLKTVALGAPSFEARFQGLFRECIATRAVRTTSVYRHGGENMAVALAPIPGADGRVVGVLAIERLMTGYDSVLLKARRHVMWLAGAALAVSVFVGLLTSLRVTRPLKSLYAAVLAAREGRFEPAPVGGAHELAEFARSFNDTHAALQSRMAELTDLNARLDAAMSARTCELTAACESMRRVQMAVGDDLVAARRVQETIIPRSLRRDRFTVAVEYVPIREIGGDLGIVLEHGPSVFDVAVGDVTGHGVGAALVGNRVHALLSSFGAAHERLDKLYRRLDRLLSRETSGLGMFLTLFSCRFNLDRMTMEFAGAGHVPALHFRPSTRVITVLESRCGIIGLGDLECEDPAGQKIDLERGDYVCLYTDGLVEAANASWKAFGMERLCAVFIEAAMSSDGSDVAAAIARAASDFTGGRFQDDMSVLVVRVS